MSRLVVVASGAALGVLGCGRSVDPQLERTSSSEPMAGASTREILTPAVPGSTLPTAVIASAPPFSCPSSMLRIPGGPFQPGSADGLSDERPRFITRLADYCLDKTEVTAAAYEACVVSGKCTPSVGTQSTCNAGREGREHHPMNCVTWIQASAYCASQQARLPTEAEWEYAARGGAEERKYSWGDAAPGNQLCWKRNGSCEVASFGAGAFGLFDMIGNVWEWTADWYGPYPWPPMDGPHKIYRGGSWSRRFEKWLSPTLRNRYAPDHWGSHLGFRCARRLGECPFGEDERGTCLAGVTHMDCPLRQSFNGARCATPSDPVCEVGSEQVPGHGCVATAQSRNVSHAHASQTVIATAVRSTRSPQFDADCRAYHPKRPKAYRFEQGTHAERNVAGAKHGCKNRDVGGGWNSACCPE